MRRRAALALALVVAAASCTRPSEERAAAELDIGIASISDAVVSVGDGLAAVRKIGDGELELWASAPSIRFTLDLGSTAAGPWKITVRNIMADAVLVEGGTALTPREPDQHPTVGIFHLNLNAGSHTFRVAPLDADLIEPYRVAAMADIQTALPFVDDVFEKINAVPGLRYVIAMGDITERSLIDEYDLFEKQLIVLQLPFYTTLGNHELWAPFSRYHERFGRASFQFEFKGVAFTFVDSGDGGLDPLVDNWLDTWLDAAKDKTNVFLTHMPPVDPVGTRYGGFRSAEDGRRLVSKLIKGNVDLGLYGHIHTYIEYDDAGIPSFISGGGGADPMAWDGIDRHFLTVDFDPANNRVNTVDLHRVDP